jgi:hypothetical protein
LNNKYKSNFTRKKAQKHEKRKKAELIKLNRIMQAVLCCLCPMVPPVRETFVIDQFAVLSISENLIG